MVTDIKGNVGATRELRRLLFDERTWALALKRDDAIVQPLLGFINRVIVDKIVLPRIKMQLA